MTTAERNIGWPGAMAIGIGGMVGGGIFAVLGEAVSLAHGATAVAFASYALTFFGPGHGPWLRHLLISLSILVPIGINLLNAAAVARSESLVVVLKLARTYADSPHTLWIFAGFLAGALLFELLYSRFRHGHLRGAAMRWPGA